MNGAQHGDQSTVGPDDGTGPLVRDEDSEFSFQVGQPDVLSLLAGLRIASFDEKSPLAALLRDEQRATPAKSSDLLRSLAGNPDVAKTIAILSRPALIMENRAGGGTKPIGFFTVCHAPDIDNQAFATVLPSAEGFLFVLHPTRFHFLAWWLGSHASKANEPVPNHLPPPLDLGSLVCALHVIDLFRRCSFENLLAHVTSEPAIQPDGFLDSLQTSVAGRDLRWLVPSFIGLTPGLDFGGFGERTDPIEKLARMDMLFAADGGGNPLLHFGEAGKRLGVEFYHSWFQAIGFRTLVRIGTEWTAAHSGFLAPTGLANHLFLIDGPTVNHQALTRDLLDRKLVKLFGDAVIPPYSTMRRDAN
jgi:hypothetical protein